MVSTVSKSHSFVVVGKEFDVFGADEEGGAAGAATVNLQVVLVNFTIRRTLLRNNITN
jgi:hypothetical protein